MSNVRKIRATVQKLWRLADAKRNSNPHEAAAAATLAERLTVKYHLRNDPFFPVTRQTLEESERTITQIQKDMQRILRNYERTTIEQQQVLEKAAKAFQEFAV